jgi:hypothetical protein
MVDVVQVLVRAKVAWRLVTANQITQLLWRQSLCAQPTATTCECAFWKTRVANSMEGLVRLRYMRERSNVTMVVRSVVGPGMTGFGPKADGRLFERACHSSCN